MAKRRYGMTEAKIARFLKQGRGTGEGLSYKPWLTVHDVSSKGRVSRMLGRCNRRVHHLLSDIERSAFLSYDWRDDVVDIREQFPLDRGATCVIATEMGLAHPRDPGTGVAVVMTTDLLVVFADDSVRAVACKSSSDLGVTRTAEKLEIERAYWALLGREWKLWTERSTTRVRTENLAFLHEYLDADAWDWLPRGHWTRRAAVFLAMFTRADPATPFAAFAASFDSTAGFAAGDAIATMRYLASRKALAFDVDVKFDPSAPIGRSLKLPPRVAMEEAA